MMQLKLTTAAALLLLAAGQTVPSDEPRRVVQTARQAVEGDSADAVRARFDAQRRTTGSEPLALLGLATLSRMAGDNPAAEQRYRELLALVPATSQIAGYAQLGLAAAAHVTGRFPEAQRWTQLAARSSRAAGDSTLLAEVYLEFATLRARQPGRDASLAATLVLLDSAAQVVPDQAYDVRAGMHGRRGTVYSLLGRTAEAAADLRACADLSERGQMPRVGGTCLHMMGVELDRRGQTDSALAMMHAAEAIQERARDHRGLGLTLGQHGTFLRRRGDYGAAREVLVRSVAEQVAAGGSAADELIELGELSRAAGDRVAALEFANRGAAALEREQGVVGLAIARGLQAALAADAGDYTEAERLQRARLDWARQDNRLAMQADVLAELAELYERRGMLERARALLDSSAVVRRRLVPRVGAARGEAGTSALDYQGGRLALRQGRLDDAQRLLERYLASLAPDQHLHRYRARARLAELRMRRGDLAGAQRLLTEATAALDSWRETLVDAELRVAAFQVDAFDEQDLGVPAVLAALSVRDPAAAFALAERRRARELADRIARADALRTVESTSATAGSHARATDTRFRAISASDVATALPDSTTVLLEYVTGAEGAPTTLFVVTRRGVHAHRLATADSLTRPIGRFLALLEGGAEPRVLAASLGAALLGPAAEDLGPSVTRVIVVPDGPLHRVPFDALRLADGRYVLEHFAVGVAPSGAVLRELWGRRGTLAAQGARPARMLALGDPDFGTVATAAGPTTLQPVSSQSFRSAFSAVGGLPRLAGSGEEARSVARYAAQSNVWLGHDASEAELKRASLRGVSVLHLATHALVDEGVADRTAIALAPGDGEDGFLSLGELSALTLDADLVVLSACRSAGGVVVRGEGVQGLASAFLQAGARAVVATGWRIGDRSTVALVDAMYEAIARGQPLDQALRSAKLAALRRGEPPNSWAAFTVVGDPTVTVPLQPPSLASRVPSRWWIGLLVLAAIAAAWAWTAGRHRPRMAS